MDIFWNYTLFKSDFFVKSDLPINKSVQNNILFCIFVAQKESKIMLSINDCYIPCCNNDCFHCCELSLLIDKLVRALASHQYIPCLIPSSG